MSRLAIDIVLLPSEEMLEHAIAVNEQLRQQNPPKIVLDKINCLPHISLLMGCISQSDLPWISEIVTAIAHSEPIFQLEITAVKTDPMPDGRKVTVLNISPDRRLQTLHETLIDQLQAFLSFDATPEMLYNPPEVEEISLLSINNYLKSSSFNHFSPHITAGIGAYHHGNYSISFTASTLAICHLGNYCTCRKVLYAVTLKA